MPQDELTDKGSEERSTYFDQSEGLTDYVCAQVGPARFLVKTEDKHIGRSLFVKQGRGDIKVLSRCVKTVEALTGQKGLQGSTFIDVGANIGSTTVFALLANEFTDAVALEPEPENFMTLRLNLLLNGLEGRAKALQVAVSNVLGELDLVVTRSRSGKHWIATDANKKLHKDELLLKVPTVTLDSLGTDGTFELKKVGLVWLDAENHEGQILEGASELVSRGVPLVFEWDPAGLDERGDRGKIRDIVGEHYTHFADMRACADPQEAKYRLQPADALGDYKHFVAPGEEHFTEILVLRLRPKQVPQASLASVLRGAPARPEKGRKKERLKQKRRSAAEKSAATD